MTDQRAPGGDPYDWLLQEFSEDLRARGKVPLGETPPQLDFDTVLQQKREQAWAKHAPRYEKAVASGNINLANRIESQVSNLAVNLTVNALKAARNGQSPRGASTTPPVVDEWARFPDAPPEVVARFREPSMPIDKPQVGAGEHGLPYLPPLPEPEPRAEMRSANTPIGDVYAQRFGTAAGPAFSALDRAGNIARTTARSLSGIEMAESAGRDLAEAVETGDPLRAAAGAGTAGLAALPYAGPAARAAFATVPRAVATMGAYAGLPTLAAGAVMPTEARAGEASDIFDRFANTARAFVEREADFTPMDRENFFQQRRTPRQSLEEAQREAARQVETSQEYKDYLAQNRRTAANRLVEQAMTRAKSRWAESQATIPQEEERLQKQYSEHVKDMAARREAHYNKSWQDRAPTVAMMLGAASYILPALLARKGLNKIADEGKSIIAKVQAARDANNARAEATALLELDRWGNRAVGKQLWVVTKASLIPAEIRAGGEIWDKYFIPEGSGAQQRAREKLDKIFSSIPSAMQELGPSFLSGFASSALGSFFSRSAPVNAAHGERANLRGMSAEGMAPDEIARALMERRRPLQPEQSTQPPPPERVIGRGKDKNNRTFYYDPLTGYRLSSPQHPTGQPRASGQPAPQGPAGTAPREMSLLDRLLFWGGHR